jgi:uncharacterized protein
MPDQSGERQTRRNNGECHLNLWLIFITGLTTGGLTCLAVQGGLLATAITRQKQVEVSRQAQQGTGSTTQTSIQLPDNPRPIVYFLAAKLVSYTLLGFLLGALGSVVQLSPTVRAVMLLLAGLFMIATALNMLNVHPIFRYAVIQPPRFLTRLVRDQAKSEEVFAPVLLGAMTVFIPCGTTQAMEVLALTSGLPLQGALTMFFFILGTIPTFFMLGFAATQARGKARFAFSFAAAVLVLGLGLYSLDSGLKLADSPFAPGLALSKLFQPRSLDSAVEGREVDGVQELVIDVYPTSYSPNYFVAESGKPIRLLMVTNSAYGCTRSFTVPSLGIQIVLPETGETPIDIPPQQAGTLHFTCGMGMYSGSIVIQ